MENILILAVFAATIIIVIMIFVHQDKTRLEYALHEKSMKEILPTRMQAYERITLYLERISPNNMVMRELMKAKTAQDLHILLTNSIRQEFDHNIAMQIYIMPKSWELVLQAREAVMKCINDEAKNIDPKQPATVLANGILGGKRNECEDDIKYAIDSLRRDVIGLFSNKKTTKKK